MRLEGKRIVVTGGASGIGRAICTLFAEEGARLLIGDLDEAGARETARMIEEAGGAAGVMSADVSVEADVARLVDHAASSLGGIDVLVNNAAAFVFGKIEDVEPSHWDKVLGVNVVGSANMVRHALPHLKRAGNGAIVNIASVSGFVAAPAFVPYNTSKGALLQLTRSLAMDLGAYSIRVNAVCPGAIYTPATEAHLKFDGRDRDTFLQEEAGASVFKRQGTAREVAYAALFLASDEASFVTGANLVVDGGATI